MNAGVKEEKRGNVQPSVTLRNRDVCGDKSIGKWEIFLMIWWGSGMVWISIHTKHFYLIEMSSMTSSKSFFHVSLFTFRKRTLENTRDSLTFTKSGVSDGNHRCYYCISLNVKWLTEAKRGLNLKQKISLCHVTERWQFSEITLSESHLVTPTHGRLVSVSFQTCWGLDRAKA